MPGATDVKGQYFYNVKTSSKWEILNCLRGRPRNFDRHRRIDRRDRYGQRVDGLPIKFSIDKYDRIRTEKNVCHFFDGVLQNEQVLTSNGRVRPIINEKGVIFYCNSQCYGQFFEAEKKPGVRGRISYYDLITEGCSRDLILSRYKVFEAYEGRRQRPKKRRRPPKRGEKKRPKPPR